MKGSDIKEKLVSSGFKLVDVAQKMGIIPQTFQSLLRTDDMKVGVLQDIAKAIDQDITFFFDNIEMPAYQYDVQLDEIIKAQLHYVQFYTVSILYHLRHINEFTGGKKFDKKQFKKEEAYAEQFQLDFEEPFYKKYSTSQKLDFIKELNEATRIYFDNMFVISREIHNRIYISDTNSNQPNPSK